MKVNVEVFEDPADGSFVVRTQMFDDDVKLGEFLLPGGTSLTEAEAMAQSLVRLAESGFDMRQLIAEWLNS